MSLRIANKVYSDYRIKEMITKDKTEATKLRGWDGFCELIGLFGAGKEKKNALECLYDKLHDVAIENNSNQEKLNNKVIDCLIIFNKISKLVNEGKKPIDRINFSINLESVNLPGNLVFKVDDAELLTINSSILLLEQNWIKNLEDEGGIYCGILQDSLSNEIIKSTNPSIILTNVAKTIYKKTVAELKSELEHKLKHKLKHKLDELNKINFSTGKLRLSKFSLGIKEQFENKKALLKEQFEKIKTEIISIESDLKKLY